MAKSAYIRPGTPRRQAQAITARKRKGNLAWDFVGVPGGRAGYIDEREYRFPLSDYALDGFAPSQEDAQTEQEAMIALAYTRLSLAIVVGVINDSIALWDRWKNRSWIHLYNERLSQGFTREQAARQCGVSVAEALRESRNYNIEWGDSSWEWIKGKSFRYYVEYLGRDPEDVIQVIQDFVSGARQLGVTEGDIEQLVLPGYRETPRTVWRRTAGVQEQEVDLVTEMLRDDGPNEDDIAEIEDFMSELAEPILHAA